MRHASRRYLRHTADGVVISRERVCRCGQPFVQNQLAAELVEQSEGIRRAFVEAFAGEGWIPVMCPPCEHRSLAGDGPARPANLEREPEPELW